MERKRSESTIYDLPPPEPPTKREPGIRAAFLLHAGYMAEHLASQGGQHSLTPKVTDQPSMWPVLDSPTALGLAGTLLFCSPNVTLHRFIEAFMDAVDGPQDEPRFQALREKAREAERDMRMPKGYAIGLAAVYFYGNAQREAAKASAAKASTGV